MKSLSRPTVYAVSVALLLVLFAARLPLLDSIPPFIDEANQIAIGETMLHTSPLYGASEGRLLAIWYWLPFQPHTNAAFFVARAASLLLVVLNAAALMAAGRFLAGQPGMVFAGLVFLFSPFHTFFGSLALADTVAVSLLALALALTLAQYRRVSLAGAVLTGALLAAALGAKVSYLPFAVLPVFGAALMRPPGRPWRDQVRWLAVALGVFALLYGAFLAVQFWRGYNPLSIVLRGGDGGVFSLAALIPRLGERARRIGGVYLFYTGAVSGVVTVALLVVHLVRRRVVLPLLLVGPGAAVWVSHMFFTRYLYLHVMLLLLIAGVELGTLARRRAGLWLAAGLMAAHAALVWMPFTLAMQSTPEQMRLLPDDYSEYFAADSAGAGILETVDFLRAGQPARVIGLLPNCNALRYTAVNAFPVECPRISPNGQDIPALTALVAGNRAPGVFVVHENSPYVPAEIPGAVVYRVERPGDLTALTVYALAP